MIGPRLSQFNEVYNISFPIPAPERRQNAQQEIDQHQLTRFHSITNQYICTDKLEIPYLKMDTYTQNGKFFPAMFSAFCQNQHNASL